MAGMKTAAMTTAEEIEGMDLHELAAVPWASESVRYALRCAERGYLRGIVLGFVRDALLADRAILELEGRIAALELVMAGTPVKFELTARGRAALDALKADAERRAGAGPVGADADVGDAAAAMDGADPEDVEVG